MKIKDLLSLSFWVIGIILTIYYGAVVRFINPDMTEMRLFYTYWYGYLMIFGCFVAAIFLMNKD